MKVPYHLIKYSNNNIAVVYNNKIKIKNLKTNEEIEINQDEVKKSNIRSIAFNEDGSTLAVASDDKKLRFWDIKTGNCLSTKNSPKKVNSIVFEKTGRRILIADGFGDVYRYSVDDSNEEGELMLGHVSMLTDLLLSNDEKYIITSDRDEKIRVTQYPKTYIIHNYCLGHKEYISKMLFLPNNDNLLLSGGGDDCIFLWDYINAKIVQEINIKSLIEKTIKNNKLNPVESYNVRDIISYPKKNLIAICFEKLPAIFVFEIVKERLNIKHTIITENLILDIAFDNQGRIWITNFVEKNTKNLITIVSKFSPVEFITSNEQLKFFENTEECERNDIAKYMTTENLRKEVLDSKKALQEENMAKRQKTE